MIIEVEAELCFQVEGNFRPGKPAYYDSYFGNWLPGEAPDVQNMKVFVHGSKKAIEITPALCDSELDFFRAKFIDACEAED